MEQQQENDRPLGRNVAPPDGGVVEDMRVRVEGDLATLRDDIQPFHLELAPSFDEYVVRYALQLLEWNGRHNLLSRRDEQNVIRRHVSASLGVFLLETKSDGRWIDVGSGAGFPGMVLKLARPDIEMNLLDSLSKRCEFLSSVSETLQLPRLKVWNCRAEDHVAKLGSGQYDVVTCKAVSSFSKSIPAFGPLVAPGGSFVTFKGPAWRTELTAAESCLHQHGLKFSSALRVPWTKTHIVQLQRVRQR